jgi:hypothetical protein
MASNFCLIFFELSGAAAEHMRCGYRCSTRVSSINRRNVRFLHRRRATMLDEPMISDFLFEFLGQA